MILLVMMLSDDCRKMRIANDLVYQIQKRRKSLDSCGGPKRPAKADQRMGRRGEGEAENSTSAATIHPCKKKKKKKKVGCGAGGEKIKAHTQGKKTKTTTKKLSLKKWYLVVFIYPTGRAED